MITTTPPEHRKSSFNCPHCNAFSGMKWDDLLWDDHSSSGFESATCHSCQKKSVWILKRFSFEDPDRAKIVFPQVTTAETPHPQMPTEIKNIFDEARQIASLSPRSAAALLRLCIEKLCRILTKQENGEINKMIASLVKDGLSPKIQKALDTVRVIGNEAVHPGQLDLSDGDTYVYPLFRLINLIIEEQIARPKEIDDLFDLLPESKRKGIENRDGQ